MDTAEDLIYLLFKYFKVNSNVDLAEIMRTTPQTITNWKGRNSIKAISNKCRELGIYNDIFKNINTQNIRSISGGQVAQNINGDMVQHKNDESNINIDKATYGLFLEAYLKAKDANDIKLFRVHLMDY